MNSEKILIEINVAGVNRSFDCIVPRTLSAKLLCRGFLELVEQSMGIPFGAYRQALLMSERTGCILSPYCSGTRRISVGCTSWRPFLSRHWNTLKTYIIKYMRFSKSRTGRDSGGS